MPAETPATRLLPCPVCFIASAADGENDIMTATAMFVSEKENLVLVSLAQGHTTARLIDRAGDFILALAAEEQEELAWKAGGALPAGRDKIEFLGAPTITALPGKPDIPAGCSAWFHCRVQSRSEAGDYVIFTAKVEASADFGLRPLIWRNDKMFGLKPLA